MKFNYEKTIEVNNQFKVNVDEQQNDINENYNKDDKDKVQEISGAETPL